MIIANRSLKRTAPGMASGFYLALFISLGAGHWVMPTGSSTRFHLLPDSGFGLCLISRCSHS